MKIKTSLFIILSLLWIIGCKDSSTTTEDSLYDEVMAIHDEIMPKMKDINDAKKQLKKIQNEENQAQVDALILQLDQADEAMMEWMNQFKPPQAEDKAARDTYLQMQKSKIVAVQEQMMSAIADAKSILPVEE